MLSERGCLNRERQDHAGEYKQPMMRKALCAGAGRGEDTLLVGTLVIE